MNDQEHQLPSTEETIKELLEKIKKLEEEKNQYYESLRKAKNDVLRIKAEYEQKEEELKNLANADLIYRLIGVLDSFELAFEKVPAEKIERGFYLIYCQLKDILEKNGLEEITPLNQKFDPQYCEAVAKKKCEKEKCDLSDEDIIVEVLSKGYFLKGRLLRPVRVKVIYHE